MWQRGWKPGMETVCRWDPSGLGWGWDPGAPLLVHCAHKLLDVRGQQVIHLVALDRTGWGQRLWVQGERWGDAVEQKESSPTLDFMTACSSGPESHPLPRMGWHGPESA